MDKIIGREEEWSRLDDYFNSNRGEFIAVYGRRRVGKTFLIRSYFKDKFDFYVSGIIDGSAEAQMEAFCLSLDRCGHKGEKPKTWAEAFSLLGDLLEKKSRRKRGRVVVFIDELPCLDTPRSGLVQALDLFWNSRVSWLNNVFFVVSGSDTSWMMHNILNDKAGLYKRKTHTLHLRPFTLAQTEAYLLSRQIRWPKIFVLQIYMVLGGIPYYLAMLHPKKNVPDNIDSLFFSQESELKSEFNCLFHSLFRNADIYMSIVQLLSTRSGGFTRKEIASNLGLTYNGHLSAMLDDLESCDFIRCFNNGNKKSYGVYQLTDLFSFFHFQFGVRRITDEHFWRNSLGTPELDDWYKQAFDKVCLWHIGQIIRGLRIDCIRHEYYAWRSSHADASSQVDLVIDRADGIVTLCEMRFSKDDYELSDKEYRMLVRKMNTFRKEYKKKVGVQACIITPYSLQDNMYSEISHTAVTMTELFK